MIYLITGNGKGKTTSALGALIRGLGWRKKCALVFFNKGGSHYGEQNILDFLQEKTPGGRMKVYRFGAVRFDAKRGTFRLGNTNEDQQEATKALNKVAALLRQKYFLVVADEIVGALAGGLITEKAVRQLLATCPKETYLYLTGRGAPAWLIKKADLVSEVREIRHPYKKGVKAIKGVEY